MFEWLRREVPIVVFPAPEVRKVQEDEFTEVQPTLLLSLKKWPAALRFERVNKSGWTRVYFTEGKHELFLGAEDSCIIFTNFINLLDGHHSSHKLLKMPFGDHIRWGCTLSETHTCVYYARTTTGLTLFFQDKNAQLTAKVELEESDRRNWISGLKEVLQ